MGVPQSKEIAHGEEYAKNVMFLCNHNSCRSQMADGWMRHLRGEASVGCASAGIVGGTAVKPGAITARPRRREPFFSRNGPSARRANEMRETTETERFGAARREADERLEKISKRRHARASETTRKKPLRESPRS